MNKKLKGLVFAITATMMVTTLAACRANKTEPTADPSATTKKDPVTLNLYLFGNDNAHYRNVDPVIAKVNEQIQSKLSTTIKVTWTPVGDYGTKLPLWLASGENIDLLNSWDTAKYAKDGAYADLTNYFNNSKYPGLKKAFSADFVNDNKFSGKNYAIPLANTFMDMEGVWYRKDLLTKYGMKDITSYDDLYNFLQKVSENEKDIIPMGNYGNFAFFKLFTDTNARQLDGKVFSFTGYGNNNSPKNNFIDVQISDDGKSVKGIAAYGDPDSEWANFNPKYGKQYLLDQFNQAVRFNKFIPKDVLTNTAATGRDFAAGYGTVGGFLNQTNTVKSKFPNAELGFWPIMKNAQDLTPGGQSTDGRTNNFAAVPASSKNVDRTMEFLDWLYADQKNNDLLTYGIEGTNWTAVGTNQWKVPDGVDPAKNYLFPGYQLTWNPTLNRIPAGLPTQVQKYFEYEFNPASYKKNAIAGFTFDQEPVKNEIAKCNTVVAKYTPFLLSGIGDVNDNLSKMNKELKDAGVDKVKVELKNQINTFLAQKK